MTCLRTATRVLLALCLLAVPVMSGSDRPVEIKSLINDVTAFIRDIDKDLTTLYTTLLDSVSSWSVPGWILWIVDILAGVLRSLAGSAALWTCRQIPEPWWGMPVIRQLQCYERIYPYWSLFIRVARVIALLTAVGVSLVLVYAFARAQADVVALVTCRRGRSANWILAWIYGTDVSVRIFRPRAPCGEDPGERRWTTTADGTIEHFSNGERELTQPINVTNGTFSICGGWFPMLIQCTRDGHFVDVVMTAQSPWTGSECYREPPSKNVIVRRETGENGTGVWLARAGGLTSIYLPPSVWDTLVSSLQASGKSTTVYSVSTVLRTHNPKCEAAEVNLYAAAIAHWWNDESPEASYEEVVPNQSICFVGDRRDDVTADWKPSGRCVGPDFVDHPDSAPTIGHQSDLSAVHYRLDTVRNKVAPFLDGEVQEYLREFVSLTVEGFRGEPWSLEQVLEKQDGPLQRQRNEKAKWWLFSGSPASVEAMIKKEPIVNDGAPRNISTTKPEFNLQLGRFMLAAAEHLKSRHAWYAAGRTPTVVAERLVTLAMMARNHGVPLCAADVSKMDAGKHPWITAHVTTSVYMALFPSYEAEIAELRKAEATASAKTSTGLKYAVACSQGSGFASTTIDNTITSAAMSFVAHRIEGLNAVDSYERLGAYYGDDSVSLNSSTSILEMGKRLGYKLTLEEFTEQDNRPVPFLSRYFPHLWSGGTASIADPVRIARKLHLSFSPTSISTMQAAANKYRGLTELDPGVSVYHSLYSAVRRVTGCNGDLSDLGWLWNEYVQGGGWPQLTDADDYWEEYTRVPPAVYNNWAARVTTWKEWMKGPPRLIPVEHETKIPLTVHPGEPMAIAPVPSTEPPPPEATVGVEKKDWDPKIAKLDEAARKQIASALHQANAVRRVEVREAGAGRRHARSPAGPRITVWTPSKDKRGSPSDPQP